MNNSILPLVSVIIPAYNAALFIERTLISVLTQTYQNLEIIVVDDGSQDETVAVIEQYAKQDDRILLLQQENAGVAAARNFGIRASQGEFIAPIDADDIWYPENIEKQVNCAIAGGEKVGLVYSWSVDIDENDAIRGGFRASDIEGDIYKTLVCHNFLGNASSSLIRRSYLNQVGDYDSNLKAQNAQGCEDWDLYLRLANVADYAVVPEFLVGYRKLRHSMSCNYDTMKRSHDLVMATVAQNRPNLPHWLYSISRSNLYTYFAHQSASNADWNNTLFWVKKAIQAHGLLALIRIGTYRLLLSAFFARFQSPNRAVSEAIATTPNLTLENIKQQKSKLFLMLFVGKVFHQTINTLSKGAIALRQEKNYNSLTLLSKASKI
ncbi:MAG: glycosyltransferase family A protein [Jaaginema sp. PMC 1079.18]|nr:glycosyltransferase family A protein [Jaaginema sp. PMC 1080.18]MEC4850276.1 glycosyltransferase family A protein [Jaaginema sp. PMC 1079.18]MEC4866898.1 glycosyltransferase family A protein [Jaaginema sp. PMC 1078.18]